MPDIILRRASSGSLFDTAELPHAGLFLSKGISEWKEDSNRKGEDFQSHVKNLAHMPSPGIYQAAYNRWCTIVMNNATILPWAGKLNNRMFIGLGGASVIETAITLSRTYGVPLIPGSAQKGLTRAYAIHSGLDLSTRNILFGKEGQTPESMESGYIIFNDAWWIPNSTEPPLTTEIVTVHHHDYYQKAGEVDATDFDSPVPNIQISARGSFLFTIECASHSLAKLTLDLLTQALDKWGIGGKTAAGYGRFTLDKNAIDKLHSERVHIWDKALIRYANNTGSLEISYENQKAVPIKINKAEIEENWPGLLKKMKKKATFVRVTIKKTGNKIDVISIENQNIADISLVSG